MPTNIADLVPNVVIGIDPENLGLISEQTALNYLRAAILPFNSLVAKGFDIAADVLDRDARYLEKRALVLLAIREWLLAKSREFSTMAIKHSNVAGSTNLTGMEFAMAKRVKEMEAMGPNMAAEFGHVIRRLSQSGVMVGGGVSNLPYPDVNGPTPPGPWWTGYGSGGNWP